MTQRRVPAIGLLISVIITLFTALPCWSEADFLSNIEPKFILHSPSLRKAPSIKSSSSTAPLINSPLNNSLPEINLPKFAIIIDDLGYSLSQSKKAANLPGAVTVAVIPHSPHAVQIANLAHSLGKEVMLHAPMSNIQGKPLDPGALTADMEQPVFLSTLKQALSAFPHISGVNNHMGSELTQQREPMQWLMTELKYRDLFFIDSRTSPNSLAWQVAQENSIPTLKRDVFLDHDPKPSKIAEQFNVLLSLARKRGFAVAIAHPHPETLDFLEEVLPGLEGQGYRLTSISNLLSPPKPQVKTQHSLATTE